MVIPSGVADLAISAATAAIKLGKRLDRIMAEEAALRSGLSLSIPPTAHVPVVTEFRRELRRFEKETRGLRPDPLREDRERIKELVQSGTRDELEEMCTKHGITDFGLAVFDVDAAVSDVLLARSSAWDLEDADIRSLVFYVAAGEEHRKNSLSFRLGATVLDVLAEFAAEDARFVVEDEDTRKLVQTILTRFSKPDLSELSGWGEVVKNLLRATVNGVLDARDLVHGSREWLEVLLDGLARARDLAPNGDDFIFGIARGEGFKLLVRGILEEAAEVLSDEQSSELQQVIAGVLETAAARVEGAPDFEAYFQENWHALVGAGLGGLAEHGPRLLEGEDPILQKTLTAMVGALADSFSAGPPTGETLVSVANAAIAVFADDPDLLEGSIGEEWARELIQSLAAVAKDAGLREAFSQPALERYSRAALEVMASHPDVLAGDGELARKIVSKVLGGMARAEALSLESLGDAAVESALRAIAENPGLLDLEYAEAFGDLAGKLAERVGQKTLAGFQAEDLLRSVGEVVATNSMLFLDARDGLAQVVVETVLQLAEDDEGLLAGAAAVATVRRVLEVFAARGNLLPEDETLTQLEARLRELLDRSLETASDQIGRSLAQADVPEALAKVVDVWAQGELDVADPDFAQLFEDLIKAA